MKYTVCIKKVDDDGNEIISSVSDELFSTALGHALPGIQWHVGGCVFHEVADAFLVFLYHANRDFDDRELDRNLKKLAKVLEQIANSLTPAEKAAKRRQLKAEQAKLAEQMAILEAKPPAPATR